MVSDLNMVVGGRGRHGGQRARAPAGQVTAVGGVRRLRVFLHGLKDIKSFSAKHQGRASARRRTASVTTISTIRSVNPKSNRGFHTACLQPHLGPLT